MLIRFDFYHWIAIFILLILIKLVVDLKNTKIGQDALQQLKVAAETAERVAKQVGETQVYKQVSYAAHEIDKLADVRMYTKPGF